ncbi:hypothetical protein OROMI_011969 [Orobanche minor]
MKTIGVRNQSCVLPPMLSRNPGRPRTSRKKGAGESEKGSNKRKYNITCSTCGTSGHNQRVCKEGPTAAERRARGGATTRGRGRQRSYIVEMLSQVSNLTQQSQVML